MRSLTGSQSGWLPQRDGRFDLVPLLSLRRITSLALALLFAVAAAAAYGMLQIERGDRWDHQIIAWSTCGMLVSLAIAMLLLGRYLMQRSLRHVEDQLRVLAREDRLEPLTAAIPDELHAVMAALGDYVAAVRGRVDRLRLQKKELDIQMRTADAERRHTEAIIYSISDAVLVIDIFGELVLANAAAEELFNFRLSEWRQRPIDRIIRDSSVLGLLKEARGRVGGDQRRCVEYSTIRDARTQTYSITLSRVVDSEGQLRGAVAVFHDITRERQIAQVKTDFVSAVSHELRTPLSSIKAYTEMLMDGEAHDETTRREFYNIIASETDRLQRLISKILDISRIEAGVMEIHRSPVNPNEVVRAVLDMVAPQAREHHVVIEPELDDSLPQLYADRDLLYQAVQNVVTNAIKYTRRAGLGEGDALSATEFGRVSVRTALDHEKRQYTITVTDNGMGIRAEDLPRIFEKFYRSRDGASVAKGTGLGLNLVKQIVETVHQGEIAVASEHGVGTTIVMRLPLRPAEADHQFEDRSERTKVAV